MDYPSTNPPMYCHKNCYDDDDDCNPEIVDSIGILGFTSPSNMLKYKVVSRYYSSSKQTFHIISSSNING